MVTWGCVEILQQCVCSSFSTFLSHIEFRKARESELLCVCVCALTLFSRVLFKVNLASPCPLSSVDHICSLTSFLCTGQTVCLSLLHVVCHLPQALTLSAHVLLDQSKLFVTAERPAGHTDRNVCVCVRTLMQVRSSEYEYDRACREKQSASVSFEYQNEKLQLLNTLYASAYMSQTNNGRKLSRM